MILICCKTFTQEEAQLLIIRTLATLQLCHKIKIALHFWRAPLTFFLFKARTLFEGFRWLELILYEDFTRT